MWNPYGLVREPVEENATVVEMMIIDIEICDQLPAEISEYNSYDMVGASFLNNLPPKSDTQAVACTAVVYGVDEFGVNALLRVSGFRPRLLYECEHQGKRRTILSALSEQLRLDLDDLCKHSYRLEASRLYGWVPNMADLTKVKTFTYLAVTFPTVAAWRRACYVKGGTWSPIEKKVDPSMQFQDATSLIPCGWVRCESTSSCGRISHARIERACDVRDLSPIARADSAPLLVASFDIECLSKSRGFPCATNASDTVSMISTAFWRTDRPATETTVVVQCLRGCAPVDGAHIEVYQSEGELFAAWRDLIAVGSAPQIMTGCAEELFRALAALAALAAPAC